MHKSARPWFTIGAFCAVILLASAVSPRHAHAQGGHIEGVRFDGHLSLGWHRGVGPGVRLDIPLARDGLIPPHGPGGLAAARWRADRGGTTAR